MTADEVEHAVRNMRAWGKMIWMRQMRVGSGFGDDGERTMDLWGIESDRRCRRVSIEIKVSRPDFRSDVKNRMKQRRARMLCNEFYYATPGGLLTHDDIPQWAGLIEIMPITTRGQRWWGAPGATVFGKVTVSAPWFDSSAPTWRFVASLARRIAAEEKVIERRKIQTQGES